jgi:FKBP-type peptidyl-prolyl cis-trans isomerase
MKNLLIIYLSAAVSIILLVGCGTSKNIKNNNEIRKKGSVNMTRHKTESGLEYEILEQGQGESPQKGKKVTVHYTGWLDQNGEKGKKFDSSVDRQEPFSFIIGTGLVIKGWDEGVLSMKVGEKRRLFIPANLGYGSRGAGSIIPPNSKLIFDVELLKVG